MKTNHLIKALVAIIIVVIGIIVHPIISEASADIQKSFLEIPSNNALKTKNSKELKLDFDIEKLKIIKEEKKKAEEIRLMREEEERRIEEERRLAEEAARREEELNRPVYNGLSLRDLSDKLNRTLSSTLSGTGETFARLSVEYGVDPYLAVGIVMLETGCKWNCSNLVNSCNNVGGMKGAGGCGGGAYAAFPSLDEGIEAYISNLSRNYINVGLTTPESMESKYAACSGWAAQVRNYMNQIEAN